jgi:hypothetical protein
MSYEPGRCAIYLTESGAVADQDEAAAFLAAVAFVAFDSGSADALPAKLVCILLGRRGRDGEGAVELGGWGSAGAAVQYRQLARRRLRLPQLPRFEFVPFWGHGAVFYECELLHIRISSPAI